MAVNGFPLSCTPRIKTRGDLLPVETAATYKIEGKVLELRTADGALAVDYTKK